MAGRRVAAEPLEASERIKLVAIPSARLSAFHGRPIRHRAAVILPRRSPGELRPALYIVPGFGGDHRRARLFAKEDRFAYGEDIPTGIENACNRRCRKSRKSPNLRRTCDV